MKTYKIDNISFQKNKVLACFFKFILIKGEAPKNRGATEEF
jgi:hypothetical protein